MLTNRPFISRMLLKQFISESGLCGFVCNIFFLCFEVKKMKFLVLSEINKNDKTLIYDSLGSTTLQVPFTLIAVVEETNTWRK